MRDFVVSHKCYKNDSILTSEIVHDLLIACKEIGEGVEQCRPVLGDVTINRYVKLQFQNIDRPSKLTHTHTEFDLKTHMEQF